MAAKDDSLALLLRKNRVRSKKEWIGATPGTVVPLHIQLRILERQGGKCAKTGVPLVPGVKKALDHIIPLEDWPKHHDSGHGNRESNLAWMTEGAHREKTSREATERASARKAAKAHAGIKKPVQRPLKGRPLPSGHQAEKRAKDRIPVPKGPSGLARQFRPKD